MSDDHLLPLPARAPWQTEAACRDHDPDMFFPHRDDDVGPALAICAGCDVREECLQLAIDNDEVYGIYGDTTGRDRRRLRRTIPAKVTCPQCHTVFLRPRRVGQSGGQSPFCSDECRDTARRASVAASDRRGRERGAA